MPLGLGGLSEEQKVDRLRDIEEAIGAHARWMSDLRELLSKLVYERVCLAGG